MVSSRKDRMASIPDSRGGTVSIVYWWYAHGQDKTVVLRNVWILCAYTECRLQHKIHTTNKWFKCTTFKITFASHAPVWSDCLSLAWSTLNPLPSAPVYPGQTLHQTVDTTVCVPLWYCKWVWITSHLTCHWNSKTRSPWAFAHWLTTYHQRIPILNNM